MGYAALNELKWVTPGPLYLLGDPDRQVYKIRNPIPRLPTAKCRVLTANFSLGFNHLPAVDSTIEIDYFLARGLEHTGAVEILEIQNLDGTKTFLR